MSDIQDPIPSALLETVKRFEQIEPSELDPISSLQIALMRAWAENDPNSTVSLYPASFVEGFRDMAKAALSHLEIPWEEVPRGSPYK